MESQPIRQGCRWVLAGAALLGLGMVRDATAQQVPQQGPFSGSPPAPGTPAAPTPSLPAIAEAAPLSREAQLEERVRQLEAMVNRLSAQMQPGATGGGPVSVLPNIAPGATAPSNVPSPANPLHVGRRRGPGSVAAPEPAPK